MFFDHNAFITKKTCFIISVTVHLQRHTRRHTHCHTRRRHHTSCEFGKSETGMKEGRREGRREKLRV